MALQFLTRLPVPGLGRLDAAQARDALSRAMGWLPLVGTLIGLVTASVFAGARMLWPPLVAVILALVVEARLTGAFHEDAVADFCDGFGGGRTAEDVHRILKDSRIGSYGALGLGLALLLRVATTAVVPPASGGSGVARAIGAGRPVLLGAGLVAALPGLAPIAILDPFAVAAALLAGIVFLFWFGRLLRRRIGGSTGDCLGFAAYAGQLALLLAASASLCYGCR
jgi:adenosylcobinamide-GDP ribazoletransferase